MGFDCPSRESDPRLLAEILVIFPPAALALANGFVILDEYKFIADLLADVTLGDDVHQAKTGSFAYMPPLLPHAIAAKSATMMLLVQIKLPKQAIA